MNIIHFINNETLEVSDETATMLRDNLNKPGGCGQWQNFSNQHNTVFLMLNLTQICYIENTDIHNRKEKQ